MTKIDYFPNYLTKFSELLKKYDKNSFFKIIKLIKKTKKNKKKIIIVGNGGSAAMASHVSVDLTKMCQIRSINFNEADLLTCFSNDYGYKNWTNRHFIFMQTEICLLP